MTVSQSSSESEAMAKCDAWTCFTQCWRSDDVETRLRSQLEIHQARIRVISGEIQSLDTAKVGAARAGRMDVARQCIQDRRKKEAQRNKYMQLRDFCESTLVRVSDMATVSETMAALGEVRRTYGDTKMEDLYEKFGSAVQDIAQGNEAMSDVHSLIGSNSRVDDMSDEALLAELAELESSVLAEAPLPPSSVPPALQPPKPQVASLAQSYAAIGIEAS